MNNFASLKDNEAKSLIKIDFKVQGFKKIKNIILQRNGIFGFYLIDENKKKRDFIGNHYSDYSCIVRIVKD